MITIRGKQYVTVAERVAAAHEAGGFSIITSDVLPLGDGGRLFVKVQVHFAQRRYIGMAEVKLNAKPGTPDGENPLECAETSALGRALGFAGLGVVDGIASADEVLRRGTSASAEADRRQQQAAQQVRAEARAYLAAHGGRPPELQSPD